jgi:hypothetical protein
MLTLNNFFVQAQISFVSFKKEQDFYPLNQADCISEDMNSGSQCNEHTFGAGGNTQVRVILNLSKPNAKTTNH